MIRIDIYPRRGINQIEFGMPRSEVQLRLGKPEYTSERSVFEYLEISIPTPARDGYYENEIQIDYDEDNCVEFIGLSGRGAEYTDVYLADLQVFQIKAEDLLKRIVAVTGENFDPNGSEIPCNYTFRGLDLACSRPFGPETIEDGDDEANEEADDAEFFWSIGIGKEGYFDE